MTYAGFSSGPELHLVFTVLCQQSLEGLLLIVSDVLELGNLLAQLSDRALPVHMANIGQLPLQLAVLSQQRLTCERKRHDEGPCPTRIDP